MKTVYCEIRKIGTGEVFSWISFQVNESNEDTMKNSAKIRATELGYETRCIQLFSPSLDQLELPSTNRQSLTV